MADHGIRVPVEFLKAMGVEEFREAALRGYLDAEQCARLWRMTDRQGEPPRALKLQYMVRNRRELRRFLARQKPK